MLDIVDLFREHDIPKKSFDTNLATQAGVRHIIMPIAMTTFQEIKVSLRQLYLEDERPWLVGFSGGKDSTMLASLIFDVVLSIPAEQRKKPISVLCTDTRVEIPAIAEMIEGTLDRMRKCSEGSIINPLFTCYARQA